MRSLIAVAIVAVLSYCVLVTPSHAGFPAGFFTEEVAPGATFSQPIGLAFATDGRVFVAEKRGRVYIIEDGIKLATPFIDISGEVLNQHDRGLLGITLDPNFDVTGHVYLLYTVDHAGGDNDLDTYGRLTRYTASAGNPNVADLSTRLVLVGQDWGSAFPNCDRSHAIGSVRFGSDGTLLASCGDAALFTTVDDGGHYPDCFGPGRFDPNEDIGAFRSQYLASLAGKIIRVDPVTGHGLPSNPYWTGDPDDNESKVWVYGLRNPYRFMVRQNGATDPALGQPGTLYIGDVGWATWEELNIARTSGLNFGWPCYEGVNQHNGYQNANPAHTDCSTIETPPNPGPLTAPDVEWVHPDANSVISGGFNEGLRYPAQYQDSYFHCDYVRQWVREVELDAAEQVVNVSDFATNVGSIVSYEYNPFTQYFYFCNIGSGQVLRLRHTGEPQNLAPVANASANPTSGNVPLDVDFSSVGSFDPDQDPMTFNWEFGDGATSSAANPSHTYLTSGAFSVTLTVTDDSGATGFYPLTITAGNTPPTATIVTPAQAASFPVGAQVTLQGSATDPDEPSSNLSTLWEVSLIHDDHLHPNEFASTQNPATWTVQNHGTPGELFYFQVEFIVTDSGGLADTTRHYVFVDNVVPPPGQMLGELPSTSVAQSSTDFGGEPNRARDGDTNGDYFDNSVTHTNWETTPWWEADMVGTFFVDEIRVWNRTDCCSAPLTDFYVFVSDDAFTSQDLDATRNQPGVGTYFVSGEGGRPSVVAVGRTARHVRVQLSDQDVLTLAEVQIVAGTPGSTPVNLSLDPAATASQSTTDYGGDASRAIDGDTNGNFFGGSVSHTAWEANPIWEIDLGAVHPLGDVTLFNRTDCCTHALGDFYLFVSDVPFTSQDLDETRNQPGVSKWYVASEVPGSLETAVNRTGRYVRVQRASSGVLTIAECQVWSGSGGQPPINRCVSGLATTSQSSTDFGGDSIRGCDGDTNGNFFGGSVTHTGWDLNAWWEVDLGEAGAIDDIVVWNRTDCCDDILQNFYVFVSDAPFTSQDLNTTRNQPGVTEFYFLDPVVESVSIPVGGTGRYVRVQLNYQAVLTLAEVQVWADPQAATGNGAEQTGLGDSAQTAPPRLHFGMPAPNPFRTTTTIDYALPEAATVKIGIYDLHGRLVRQLVDRAEGAGTGQARWDGNFEGGAPASSGIYWLRMELGDQLQTRKLLLVR